MALNSIPSGLIPDTMRAYFQQIRQETGLRMCERVFDPVTDKPSKVSTGVNLSPEGPKRNDNVFGNCNAMRICTSCYSKEMTSLVSVEG